MKTQHSQKKKKEIKNAIRDQLYVLAKFKSPSPAL